jgi:hypothetical protein
MASSQMITSRKPRKGARFFNPRETNISRIVPMVTSRIRAKAINKGSMTQLYISAPKKSCSITIIVMMNTSLIWLQRYYFSCSQNTDSGNDGFSRQFYFLGYLVEVCIFAQNNLLHGTEISTHLLPTTVGALS